MNMKENNKYRYTDTAERNIRMNRFESEISITKFTKMCHTTISQRF